MATWWDSAGDPRGVDELIRVALAEFDLSDEELRSATAALVALQFRPTREVLDRACDLCRSADADERRLGVRVLGELRDLADPAAALPAFVDESMEVLLALAATEPDTDVLIEVARAFGYRHDPRAVEPLLAWRDHEDPSIRFFVACSLRSCRTQDNEALVVDALIELTGDEDGAVRDYALFGLRELEVDSAEVRDAMLRRVRDPDDSAAGEALVGLARLGDERAVAPLIERLQHPDSHRIIAYGLDAATALANPRLLPRCDRSSNVSATETTSARRSRPAPKAGRPDPHAQRRADSVSGCLRGCTGDAPDILDHVYAHAANRLLAGRLGVRCAE